MVQRILIAAVLMMMFGCERRYESAVMHEKATVIELSYVPATRGMTSGGVGFSMSGRGGACFVPGQSVSTREVWAVVFRCEKHGRTFALSGKSIYERAEVGMEVELEYVEILADRDGAPVVIDYDTKQVIFPKIGP